MRKSCVVFFVCKNSEGKIKILLPRYANKFENKRNGYGGKCDKKDDGEMETTLQCAAREVGDELGLKIHSKKFLNFGTIFQSQNEVDIFVVNCKYEFLFSGGDGEMINPKWYDLDDLENFKSEIFLDDQILFLELKKVLKIFFDNGEIRQIKILKNENKEFQERLLKV